MTELFANSEDPDQTPHSAASDLGLHCLPVTLLGVSRLQWVKRNSILQDTKNSQLRYQQVSAKCTELSKLQGQTNLTFNSFIPEFLRAFFFLNLGQKYCFKKGFQSKLKQNAKQCGS